jgi:CubicO group peptidase (beta-lactamase class C family)
MIRAAVAALAFSAVGSAGAAEPIGLHASLETLARDGKFSGAVVIRDARGVRFARGYGRADPFAGRRFTAATPVDSASLAKPVTAATVLALVRDGKVTLDQPVRTYLPEYPNSETTVRHLLAHSAGLPDVAVAEITGKTNADLLAEVSKPSLKLLFRPGTGFSYCNLCYSTLALLIERVTGRHYLDAVRAKAAFPGAVGLRPAKLADWQGRAIGYRTGKDGKPERADSYENELFYGTANFSVSAEQLAFWGSRWWSGPLAALRPPATTTAMIDGKPSGLTLANFYCAPQGVRCHYLGHHEGFHHMLYWDAERRLSVAMVTNNSMPAALHQRLQRALVAFAEGRPGRAAEEVAAPLPTLPVEPGSYVLSGGERITITPADPFLKVAFRGLDYTAYPVGAGVRYIPGLDIYIGGQAGGGLHWLGLYEDRHGALLAERG